MRTNLLKWTLPLIALFIGIAGFMGINAIAQEPQDKDEVDVRPLVKVEAVSSDDHQVIINSYGEVKPLESTLIASQVAGEVTSWHPNFVAGGIVARGEVLFTIEKDNYEAAVLQAEASSQVRKRH